MDRDSRQRDPSRVAVVTLTNPEIKKDVVKSTKNIWEFKGLLPILFYRIINIMISKKKWINELESLTTDPTVIIILIPMNLEIKKISSNTLKSIRKIYSTFLTQILFQTPMIINFSLDIEAITIKIWKW